MTRATDQHIPHTGTASHSPSVHTVDKAALTDSPFAALGLIPELVRAVAESGYTQPTPIQQQSIPPLLKGHDILGCAQTGTGKTASFALPILQLLNAQKKPAPVETKPVRHPPTAKKIRALVLSPTRELASQIEESFRIYGAHTGLTSTVIFGGVKQGSQVQRLRIGIDILVATPGRLLDLMGQGFVSLTDLQFFVLDEADRMLDMGFIHDVRKVLKELPPVRQSLLFSATMPPDIEALAMTFLRSPVRVAVTPPSSTADRIEQSVYKVGKNDKPKLLTHLLKDANLSRVLVFTRTKHGANKVVKQLADAGFKGEAIHGNKSQNAREAALAHFKSGETRILVATDIAARGIDVDNVSHVINYDIPNEPESYVHRIGRTARAGAEGIAVAFCDWDEQGYLNSIEKLIQKRIPVVAEHPFVSSSGARSERTDSAPAQRPQRSGHEKPRGDRPQRSGRSDSAPQRSPRPAQEGQRSQRSDHSPAPKDRGERPDRGERSERSGQGPRPPKPAQRDQGNQRRSDGPSRDANRPSGRPQGPKPGGRPHGGGAGGGGGGDRSRGNGQAQRERTERQLDWMKRYT